MSKNDINKEAENQGRRNDDALKFIRGYRPYTAY